MDLVGKKLTREILEENGDNLIGRILADFSPLKLGRVVIRGVVKKTDHYEVKVGNESREVFILPPYTEHFKFV